MRVGPTRTRVIGAVAAVALAVVALVIVQRLRNDQALYEQFDRPDGLVTNEVAYWRPADPGVVSSSTWIVTSGSLFVDHGAAWSGVPDSRPPDVASRDGNNSAVFRLVTARDDLGDSTLSVRLLVDRLVDTSATPAHDWDGVHFFTRYQDPQSLYSVSVARRDGKVAIKKKVSTEADGEGVYYTLAEEREPTPLGAWRLIDVVTRDIRDGVEIQLKIDGRSVLAATDKGVGGPPIREPGRLGIRADNTEFHFDDFEVRSNE